MTAEPTPTAVEALRLAASALLNRWDSPNWEWEKHGNTANLIADLRQALQLHGGGGDGGSLHPDGSSPVAVADLFGSGWRVESFGSEGECFVTLFSGPHAEWRARRYAGASRSDFASGSGETLPEGWENRTVDIGSTNGPEPGIRHVVLDYYRSNDVLLDQALLWTSQYLTSFQQALSGGGKAKPKSETPSNPTLQGPTREEVAGLALGLRARGFEAEARALDHLGALLKPTSPWRSIERAPECYDGATDGSTGRIPVLVCRFPFNGHHAPMVVARLTKKGWINGLKGNRLWFDPTHWMPLPALPGGEAAT